MGSHSSQSCLDIHSKCSDLAVFLQKKGHLARLAQYVVEPIVESRRLGHLLDGTYRKIWHFTELHTSLWYRSSTLIDVSCLF